MENKKIKKTINDIEGDHCKKLQSVFPEVFVDGAIDFEMLREKLSDDIVTEDEHFGLHWAGKSQAKKIAKSDIGNKTLAFCKEDSFQYENTKNLYIEGDNLEVLKLLRQNYYESVRCIYIDPPYNTGNDFVYNDKFAINRDELNGMLGKVGNLGERLNGNRDLQNQYHANWLSMMYPRLSAAKDLLEEKGVIFISIGDNEQANLKMICNEIFGEKNFLSQIIWERAFSPVNLKKHFSESHDYILCYAKNKEAAVCHGLPRNNSTNKRYGNPDHDERGPWTSGDLSVGPAIESKIYEITTPGGRKVKPPNGYCWRLDKETFAKYVDDNRIWFGEDGNNVPRIKRFLSEVKQGITPMTIWKHHEVGHSQDATQGLKKLFDNKAYFDYPKPVALVKRCIQLYSEKDSLILDFFSGSATTAQAVLELNNEDNGERQFILVQIPEKTDEKSMAYKDGYKTICDIGRERVKRVAKLIDHPGQDVGYRVFKVAETNIRWNPINAVGQINISPWEISPDSIDFMPGAEDANIVYEIMLRQRNVALSETMELLSDIGPRTYLYASRYLVCLEAAITEELVSKMADINPPPIKFMIRDSAFKDDMALKDQTLRFLKTLAEKKSGEGEPVYNVEFI